MKLTLTYPIQPVFITQKFGDTSFLQWYKDHGVVFAGHNGIDFVASHGQPIYATHDGIAYYEVDKDQGHGVVLRTNDLFDYNGGGVYFKTIYWHMVDSAKESKFKSPVEGHDAITGGLQVKVGDLIGYANSTGLSTGDHLHFGLKPVLTGEPAGIWYNLEQDNGYMGAIDPMPYFEHHIFNIDMNYGDHSIEVGYLQDYLIKNGYMAPIASPERGYYGPKTRDAVSAYQYKNKVASSWIIFWNGGKYVGAMTRLSINKN